MKKSLSGVMIFNIIIIFLLAVFALLTATFSYAKAYKVNTRIISSIERYEGYNSSALADINQYLGALGYIKGAKNNCPTTKVINGKTGTLMSNNNAQYYYCIYRFTEEQYYYSYSVTTYISIDLPMIKEFKIGVTSKTNRIYNFNSLGQSEP